MNIVDLTMEHIEAAQALALSNYWEEVAEVRVLPEVEPIPSLKHFAGNGLGCAAFDHGQMIGFLGCYRPIPRAFMTNARGMFSPIHAHAAVAEERDRIYRRMYQAAAAKWAREGAASHAIALYAHDTAALNAFFTDGFGLRCIDAIRPLEVFGPAEIKGYLLAELGRGEFERILPLCRELALHLGESPCFMKMSDGEMEHWLSDVRRRDSRIFTASKAGEAVAYLEVTAEGETFVTLVPEMMNICGAYCLPEHRGAGVTAALLNYLIKTLRQEGDGLLGVDFESINPTAHGFWLKHFTAYTNSVVRRIDEAALVRKP